MIGNVNGAQFDFKVISIEGVEMIVALFEPSSFDSPQC